MSTFLKRPRSRAVLSAFARVDDSPATRRAALRALPAVLAQQYSPTAGAGLSTVYELRVLTPAGGVETRFALSLVDGTLTVEERPAPEAAAWVGIRLGDMIRLITGTTGLWPLMADKRLELGGEPFAGLRFPGLFGLS